MRRNLFAIFTIAAVVSGVLAPIQSYAGPTASPGKSQGNGPCATSGNTNSQTQSTKNTNKTCVYKVGDIGVGGGIVFYYNVAGFNCGPEYTNTGSSAGGLCHFLEVAPSGWNSGTDPGIQWAVEAQKSSDVSGIANDTAAYNNALGIGLGYKNSNAIVLQGNDTTAAAGLARAYPGGSKSDWYLPTTAELNLLCQWNRGVTQDVTVACTGGDFNSGISASFAGLDELFYWSSSESSADWAWIQGFTDGRQLGSASGGVKSAGYNVRPVRAF